MIENLGGQTMLEVKFYEKAEDALLKFAVIFAKKDNLWIFCKHKKRNTYEAAGGHREPGEDILAAAKRELYEETGAIDYELMPVSIYSVTGRNSVVNQDEETFGMLYYAKVHELGELPVSEMEKIIIQEELPEQWTYPEIQPILLQKIREMLCDSLDLT
jgi:8-oxo-dGTP diphosphatase